jgi:hypothetical protein
MSIARPILLNMHFCKDEAELKELFANLLASSMDKDVSQFVHPSYSQIILQLSPDEIKVLSWIFMNKRQHKSPESDSRSDDDYTMVYEHTSWIEKRFRTLCEDAELDCPDRSNCYLENLIRLRLLSRNSLYSTDLRADIFPLQRDLDHPRLSVGTVYLTDFGEQFIKVCNPA